MTGLRPPPPPDAGASYLGTYGFTAWTLWLLRKHPELLALTPKAMASRAAPPRCPDPECRRPMVFRPEAWVCYWHFRRVGPEPEEVEQVPVRVPHGLEAPPIVPVDDFGRPVDVLSLVNEPLDVVYDDGAWRVKMLELAP